MFLVTRRKTGIPGLIISFALSVTLLYFIQKHVMIRKPYIINWTRTDSIACHYETEALPDALTPVGNMLPPSESIFFHETSCRGGLNSRQACAVESVARIHPSRNVYVLFSSPISDFVLENSCLSELDQFENIKLARLHTAEYAKDTALGELMAHGANNHSLWRIEHTADMLRYITLYKYGGLYLDMDMLIVKSIDPLGRNWAAREDASTVNVAALAIGKDEVGHTILTNILNDLKSNYQPNLWSHSGPGAITRALQKFCNVSNAENMTAASCHGFKVFGHEFLYPVHYSKREFYFNTGDLPNEEKTYGHHMWNKLTYDTEVMKGSPYEKLARKHCPTIWQMFGDQFGS